MIFGEAGEVVRHSALHVIVASLCLHKVCSGAHSDNDTRFLALVLVAVMTAEALAAHLRGRVEPKKYKVAKR